MVAMFRSDIDAVGGWDAAFTTWGGEDNDLYKRVVGRLRVVRMHDKGLVHRWHDKKCAAGATSKANTVCIASKYHTEGTALSALLTHCPEKMDPPQAPVASAGSPAPAPPQPAQRASDRDATTKRSTGGTVVAPGAFDEAEAYDEEDVYDA